MIESEMEALIEQLNHGYHQMEYIHSPLFAVSPSTTLIGNCASTSIIGIISPLFQAATLYQNILAVFDCSD